MGEEASEMSATVPAPLLAISLCVSLGFVLRFGVCLLILFYFLMFSLVGCYNWDLCFWMMN